VFRMYLESVVRPRRRTGQDQLPQYRARVSSGLLKVIPLRTHRQRSRLYSSLPSFFLSFFIYSEVTYSILPDTGVDQTSQSHSRGEEQPLFLPTPSFMAEEQWGLGAGFFCDFFCDFLCNFPSMLYHFWDMPGRREKGNLQQAAFGADCRPEVDSVHIAII